MISINQVDTLESLERFVDRSAVELFIHNEMKPFHDPVSAISKSLDYAFSKDEGKGGYVLVALENNVLVGITVVNQSGMDEYIPSVFLVYIAVKESHRGKGLGKSMIKRVIKNSPSSIALHVEYDNPAKKLYENIGFVSKYAEMRYEGELENGNSKNPY
ncbi:MAG: GNAT family N-acetyltransferase [Candidatus Cloacimonetes bacterium]|nr:GNAT family N-acetyltransferase [Candidatus Cloacimonadota bacterium]